MPIVNRSRFDDDVDFLPDNKIQVIGDVEGVNLVLLGTEKGTNSQIVARSYQPDPSKEELFAVPLDQLIAQSQGAINITEK